MTGPALTQPVVDAENIMCAAVPRYGCYLAAALAFEGECTKFEKEETKTPHASEMLLRNLRGTARSGHAPLAAFHRRR